MNAVLSQPFSRFLANVFTGMLLLLPLTRSSAQSYEWNSVAIKGGGFITGLLTHPGESGLMYARTDVGGVYRWNGSNRSWIALTDSVNKGDWLGVDGFAIDPTDANRLYLVCGQYTASWASQAAVLISTDRGNTWQTVTLPFWMGGNEDGRSNGERLAVDPNSPNIIWLGTRENGLWKSTDYGATWSQVTSFPVTTTANGVGMVFVEIVASSGTSGSATPVLYVGVSQSNSQLYRTTDSGASWQTVSTGATSSHVPHHAVQDGLGNLYVTFCDAPGPNGATAGSVQKLNLSTLGFSTVTPPTGQGGFGGISVDRQNPGTIVVSTMDRWWPNDVIYRSTDGGASYTAILNSGAIDNSSAPWSVARKPHWVGDVEIDPFNSASVHFITGYGVVSTTNATAASPSWFFNNDNLEETVPLDLVSPNSGPNLLSALGDIGGFRHSDLNVSPPLTDYFSTHRVTTRSIDAAEQSPNVVVRTFSESPYGAISLDGGLTWTDFASSQVPSAAGSSGPNAITLSADGARMVWMPRNSLPYYSANNGGTWTACTGAPAEPNGSPAARVAADRVNTSDMYLYLPAGANAGKVYRSVDGGVNWTQIASGLPSSGNPIQTVPGYQGHLWLPLQWNGFRRSTDGGATWTTISGFSTVNQVAFGQAASGQSYPAVYIYAQTTGGVRGVFRSTDEGATWTQINDANHQYGWINKLAGDPRVFGRVYLATSGRGIICGEDLTSTNSGPQPPATPAGLTATAGNVRVTLSWNSSSGATSYNLKRSPGNTAGPYTIIASTANTSHVDTNVVNGTAYYYVVSALNSVGESADSAYRGATPQPPPAAPANLTVTVPSARRQLNLTWSASSGATSYNVKRSTTNGGPYTTIATGVTSTSYSNTGLNSRATYYYVVSAVNAIGEGPNSNQASGTPR